MVTSNIAKAKTAIQMITISFTLIILGLKALSLAWAIPMLDIVKEYHLVYNLTLMVTIFTVITGVIYLYSNRTTIQNFLENE